MPLFVECKETTVASSQGGRGAKDLVDIAEKVPRG